MSAPPGVASKDEELTEGGYPTAGPVRQMSSGFTLRKLGSPKRSVTCRALAERLCPIAGTPGTT